MQGIKRPPVWLSDFLRWKALPPTPALRPSHNEDIWMSHFTNSLGSPPRRCLPESESNLESQQSSDGPGTCVLPSGPTSSFQALHHPSWGAPLSLTQRLYQMTDGSFSCRFLGQSHPFPKDIPSSISNLWKNKPEGQLSLEQQPGANNLSL